jgi:hypothetical protein
MTTTPIKTIEKLWDKTTKARIPMWLKAILLTLDTLALLAYSFWFLVLIDRAALLADKIANIVAYLLGLR